MLCVSLTYQFPSGVESGSYNAAFPRCEKEGWEVFLVRFGGLGESHCCHDFTIVDLVLLKEGGIKGC